MDKPIIFFSHSSKDKDLILTIKNKLDKATGGVLEIFMSSDGQSIPFGTNWIHKIEEGLQSAKIMFVFITENSIPSGWIYFESGYAYSKNIQVIPVGIGVNIGNLKAPLNLLQGFNISAADSLNNFITIINRTFDYSINESFTDSDYLELVSLIPTNAVDEVCFDKLIRVAEYELTSEYTSADGVKKQRNIEQHYNNIISYFDKNNIEYSSKYEYGELCVVVYGIMILYRREKADANIYEDEYGRIKFCVSAYNFNKSFKLLKKLLQLSEENDTNHCLDFYLKKRYSYVASIEDCAAIISAHDRYFSFDPKIINSYICDTLDLKFRILDPPYYQNFQEHILSIDFDCNNIHSANIMMLISKLNDIGVIYDNLSTI